MLNFEIKIEKIEDKDYRKLVDYLKQNNRIQISNPISLNGMEFEKQKGESVLYKNVVFRFDFPQAGSGPMTRKEATDIVTGLVQLITDLS